MTFNKFSWNYFFAFETFFCTLSQTLLLWLSKQFRLKNMWHFLQGMERSYSSRHYPWKKKRKTFWRTFVFFFCQRCFFAFMTIITNIKKRSHWFDDIEMVLFFQKVNFVSFSFVGCENDYDKMVRINHVDFDVNKISKNLNTFFKSFP